MALILVETLLQRTELPQDGARLDPANPIAQRFQAAYLPAVSGDNLGFGAQGAMSSHAQTRTATAAGPSVLFAATAQAGRSFGPTPTYPMTFVVVARQTSSANASLVELAGASGLIGGSSFRIGGGSSTTINLTARANFSSTATATATVPADANGNQALNQVLVIVGQSLSATDHRVCVNGSAVATSTTSIGALPAWDRLLFGTASGNANVSAALFGFGDAPLSDADMQRLSRSPSEVWALFEPQRIPVPVSGGGTVHNVTLTESFSSIDAASPVLTAAAALTESASAAEALVAVMAAVASLTEAASASEAQTAAQVQAAAATEVAAATDAQAATLTAARSVTEAASASDLAAAVALAVAAVSEAISATDAQSTSPVVASALTEAASASDALSSIAGLASALSESASAADAIAAAGLLIRTLTESVNAADAATTAAQLVALLTETVSLTDGQGAGTPTAHDVSIDELALALDLVVAAIAGAGIDLGSIRRVARSPALPRLARSLAQTRSTNGL